MIGYKSDFDYPEYCNPYENKKSLNEDKIDTIVEFFEDLCDMIYGRKKVDADQICFDVDEICNALGMKVPGGDVSIKSI